MIRRALWLGGAALLLSVVIASSVPAVAPPGPRLAVMRWSLKPARLELVTVDESGANPQTMAGGSAVKRPIPLPFVAPSWSPDGSLIAFTGLVGKPSRESQTRIFVVASDGADLREVRGTEEGLGPVFAPDGHTIAFARARERQPGSRGDEDDSSESSSIWLADLDSGGISRLTPWRKNVQEAPTSFSPDGTVLAVSRSGGRSRNPEVVGLRLDGSGSTTIARNAIDGVYSPDGLEIAMLRVHNRKVRIRLPNRETVATTESRTDVIVTKADGSAPRRLTDTPKAIEYWPSWDPSGQRIAYLRFRGAKAETPMLGFGGAVIEVNADGTCGRTVLASANLAFFGPTWQPGPGREAGRLPC